MTVQKGDTVRAVNTRYSFITKGSDYLVVRTDSAGFYLRDDDGDETSFNLTEGFEIVKSVSTDELTALQAWKAKALARFPALEEDETDYEAADRFVDRAYSIGTNEAFLEAFKWARENNC